MELYPEAKFLLKLLNVLWRFVLAIVGLTIIFYSILFIVIIPYNGVDVDVIENSPLKLKLNQIGTSGWGIGDVAFSNENGDELWRANFPDDSYDIYVTYGDVQNADEASEPLPLPAGEDIYLDITYLADMPMPGSGGDRYILVYRPGKKYKVKRLTSHFHDIW